MSCSDEENRMASPFSDSSSSVLSCLNNFVLDNDDVFLQDLLHSGGSKSASPVQKCGLCRSSSTATSRCQECSELLCNTCVHTHLRVRTTKDHTIIRLENESPQSLSPFLNTGTSPTGSSPNGSVYCDTHSNEILKFYCDICLTPICGYCVAREHQGHGVSYIQDAIEECRKANLKLLSDSQMGYRAVKESLNMAQKMLVAMNTRAYNVIDEISDYSSKLQAALTKRVTDLRNQVESIRQGKARVLSQQIDGLRHALGQLLTTSDQLTDALEKGLPMAQFQAKLQALSNLKYLGCVKVSLQPQENDCINFTLPDAALVMALLTFGDVQTNGSLQSNMNLGQGLWNVMENQCAPTSNNYKYIGTNNIYSANNDLLTNGLEVPCLPGFENNMPAVGEIGDKRELVRAHNPLPQQNFRQQRYDNQVTPRSRSILGIKFPSNCLYHHRQFAHPNRARLVFGKEGDDDGELCRPWGVCCTQEGHIVVADRSNNRIQVFSSTGEFLLKFGTHGSEEGQFDRPAGVAINPYGHIVVADKDNHRIQVFTQSGQYIFKFGEKGSKNGQFNYPWDVDVNSEGLIVVSDTRNHRIQLFDCKGVFLNKYGFDVQGMWKHFDSPRGVCFGPKGIVIATDFNNHRLVVIEPNFTQARFLGAEGSCLKQFLRPQGIVVDGDGHVVVADSRNNRIQVFEPNGSFLCQFGSSGKAEGQLDRPSGISLMPDGQIVVVDFGNNRIQLF